VPWCRTNAWHCHPRHEPAASIHRSPGRTRPAASSAPAETTVVPASPAGATVVDRPATALRALALGVIAAVGKGQVPGELPGRGVSAGAAVWRTRARPRAPLIGQNIASITARQTCGPRPSFPGGTASVQPIAMPSAAGHPAAAAGASSASVAPSPRRVQGAQPPGRSDAGRGACSPPTHFRTMRRLHGRPRAFRVRGRR